MVRKTRELLVCAVIKKSRLRDELRSTTGSCLHIEVPWYCTVRLGVAMRFCLDSRTSILQYWYWACLAEE